MSIIESNFMKLKISLCPLSVHEWEEPHESRHLITVSTRKRKTGFFVGKDLLKIDDDRPETHNAISTSEGATNTIPSSNFVTNLGAFAIPNLPPSLWVILTPNIPGLY